MNKLSLLVRVISEKLFPFLLMFGFYIILHGSSSPGGGFQGGVVIGAAYILFAIGVDSGKGRKLAPHMALKIVESAGVLMFVGIGMVGLIMGYSFLSNKVMGFPPQGAAGSLLGGGTLLGINIGIGIHVASTIITLFYSFIEFTPDEKTTEEAETI